MKRRQHDTRICSTTKAAREIREERLVLQSQLSGSSTSTIYLRRTTWRFSGLYLEHVRSSSKVSQKFRLGRRLSCAFQCPFMLSFLFGWNQVSRSIVSRQSSGRSDIGWESSQTNRLAAGSPKMQRLSLNRSIDWSLDDRLMIESCALGQMRLSCPCQD